jgi:hypothetical protein
MKAHHNAESNVRKEHTWEVQHHETVVGADVAEQKVNLLLPRIEAILTVTAEARMPPAFSSRFA